MAHEAAVTDPGARLDDDFLRDFVARWHAAWNSHDHRQVAALCTDDVEWHDPSLPEPGRGAATIAALMDSLARAFPAFRFVGRKEHTITVGQGPVIDQRLRGGCAAVVATDGRAIDRMS
jgi:ketosteroid isomerase-like protein